MTVTTASTEALFRPFRSSALDLPNRIVMAPMTREQAPEGVVGQTSVDYYRRRAANGVGLIITEGAWINHPAADFSRKVPRFYGEDALAGWKQVAEAVHAAGGKIAPQLWHVGTGRGAGAQSWHPALPSIGPSGIGFSDGSVENPVTLNEPMSIKDIEACIDAYAKGAADAHRLGFDGVELHAAHGYLIDQFFWSVTNRRTDAYNGTLRDRTRFAVEVVKECKRRTPPHFPLLFRFSQWKTADYGARVFETPADLAALLEPLSEAGVDVFHCSTRRYWEPGFEGSPLSLAGWTKKISGKPTIAVGSVGLDQPHQSRRIEQAQGYVTKAVPIDRLTDMLEREEFDLIAVGRALLADYAWARKTRHGATNEITPYSTAIRHIMY